MKIAIVSSFVPFVYGGARNIVDWLRKVLESQGHQVEVIYLPFQEEPEVLFEQMFAYRMIDLTNVADVVITFRPPAHLVKHPKKIIWFIHHFRIFYDLWDSEYRFFPQNLQNVARRKSLFDIDTKALTESWKVFSNSSEVSKRVLQHNNLEIPVLYPPVFEPEKFHFKRQNNEIVYLSRIEPHKRQDLLVRALAFMNKDLIVKIVGTSTNPNYVDYLFSIAKDLGVSDRLILENRWVTDEEKIEILSDCLAVAYFPLDEDSYGYPSIEAGHSLKPVITTKDSGGVTELIIHNLNGLITSPDHKSIAAAINHLDLNRDLAKKMGAEAERQIQDLGITWENVIEKLLS